jgi:gliding motility-associated-like protein
VESVNSGFGCDLVTESITIQGLTPAVASFEVSNTIQSLIDPTFSFTNTSENATNYFWDLGECDTQAPASELFTTPTPFYNPTNQDQIEYTYGCPPGLYQIMLIAYNQGICPDTAYQVIQIQDGVSVYIPNTFTPDGDMTNQYFFPVISSIISPNTFLFTIYNRWGEEVFNSKDPNEKWDGNNYITNNKCQDGVYIWKLRFIMKESGEVINKVGHVNLLR